MFGIFHASINKKNLVMVLKLYELVRIKNHDQDGVK